MDGTQNLTLAAFVMQGFFLVILRVSVNLLPATYHLLRPMTLFSVMSLGLLVFTEDMFQLVKIGSFEMTALMTPMGLSLALFLLVAGNTLFLTYLLFETGGSRKSPFTSLLLVLPVLTILLKEPLYPQVLGSMALVIIAFSVCLILSREPESAFPEDQGTDDRDSQLERRELWVFWGVTVASLLLITTVAGLTQL
ncbi:MAG: hypothetical protein O6826_04930 [Acidobacteria bacterium]|nr:hypothetical protein [Acidobacteriota bacterium]MCZ6878106.1 hypothetical protein [Acidobacteriota bacterium]